MPRTVTLPRKEIILRYRAGESALSLAHAYGVGRETMRRRLRLWGVDMRTSAEAARARRSG